jgi:hypothetical protein
MNSNWVCLRFHFIYMKCFFVFGKFLHPREGKKRSQYYKGFFGEKNGILLPHYEGFFFLICHI